MSIRQIYGSFIAFICCSLGAGFVSLPALRRQYHVDTSSSILRALTGPTEVVGKVSIDAEDIGLDEEVRARFLTGARPIVDARQLSVTSSSSSSSSSSSTHSLEIAQQRWPDIDFDVPRTLPECFLKFLAHPTAKVIVSMTIVLVMQRFLLKNFDLMDILVVCSTTVFWVLQEWILHKFLLHQPITKEGWMGYQIHKGHHSLPYYHVSLDTPEIAVVWGGIVFALAQAVFSSDGPAAAAMRLDFLVTYFFMGLLYEWTHYLAHTRYVMSVDTIVYENFIV